VNNAFLYRTGTNTADTSNPGVITTTGTNLTMTGAYFSVNATAVGGPYRIYVQTTDPGTVGAGSIWINTTAV
jgi:hypothetical protein